MMKTKLAVIACLLICSASLQAGYTFFCITSQGNDAEIGVDQLSMNVTDAGQVSYDDGSGPVMRDSVTFTFLNTGDDDAVISEIYFDDGSLLGRLSVDDSWAGVDYRDNYDGNGQNGPVSPGNLPAGNTLDPAFEATVAFSVEPSNPQPHNGVGPGEQLAITFVLKENKDYLDIINELDEGVDLRIGLHVIAFDGGGSESFVNASDTVGGNIPEPMTMVLLGIGSLFLRRKY